MDFKKIIACICIFSIAFSTFIFGFTVPSYADGFTIIDFYSALAGSNDLNTFFDRFIDDNYKSSHGCAGNNGGEHEWRYDVVHPLTYPLIGVYTCIYCGIKLNDYCADAYEQALEENELSGIGYDSEGGMLWYPTISDTAGGYFTVFNSSYKLYLDGSNLSSWPDWSITYGDRSYSINYNASSNKGLGSCNVGFQFSFPYEGSYTSHVTIAEESSFYSSNESSISFSLSYPNKVFNTLSGSLESNSYGSFNARSGTVNIYLPVFTFVPSSEHPVQQFFTVINNINSSNLNVATVNEYDEITNVYQDTTIINNDNTQITIPGGDTYNITNWDFDFNANTYHLHILEDGIEIPVNINFGIDGITIDFPDKEYHYHYVTEAEPETSPTPGPVDPTSTPTPSGRPDWWPDDYDTDDTQDWNKLFKWLEDFKTWLGKKLDQLIGKDPVIINNYEYEDADGNKQTWDPHILKDKFAFWTDVRDIGTELYSSVQAGGDAPELIIHLGAANSPFGFKYGGDEYALDLSWYGQYKESVDSISGGFLWLLYLYGIFKHLPEIFSGVGMMDNRVEDIESGHKARRRGK